MGKKKVNKLKYKDIRKYLFKKRDSNKLLIVQVMLSLSTAKCCDFLSALVSILTGGNKDEELRKRLIDDLDLNEKLDMKFFNYLYTTVV